MKFRKISPFCGQILESFPFIAEDFDQMTEYALYCKLKEKVDQIRIGVNDLGDDVSEYIIKFDNLKNYVDNYFDNLDVQDEINNKLDEMAEDGTLERLLAGTLDFVTYEMFGAVLDGETDDTNAVIECHEFANANNLRVIQNKGTLYMPSATINNCPIINTSCDFTGMTLKCDDNNDDNTIMIIADPNSLYNNDVKEINLTPSEISDLSKGNTLDISFLSDYKNHHICLETNMSFGVRNDPNDSSEIYYTQPFIVNDFAQLSPNNMYADISSNATSVKMKYLPLTQKYIDIKFDKIEITGNTENNPRILVLRNNTKLENAIINKVNYNNTTSWRQSLFEVKYSANIEIKNFTGNVPVSESTGTDTTAYVITFRECTNINFNNNKLLKGHGAIASYFCNTFNFSNNYINRFDTHYGAYGDYVIKNNSFVGYPCRVNLGYGNANVTIDSCNFYKYTENNKSWFDGIVLNRSDLGVMFSGDISISNCYIEGKRQTNNNEYVTLIQYITSSTTGTEFPAWASYNTPKINVYNIDWNMTNLSFRLCRMINNNSQTYLLRNIVLNLSQHGSQSKSLFDFTNITIGNYKIDVINADIRITASTNDTNINAYRNASITSNVNNTNVNCYENVTLDGTYKTVENKGILSLSSGTTITTLSNHGKCACNGATVTTLRSSGEILGSSLTVSTSFISGILRPTTFINNGTSHIAGCYIEVTTLTNTDHVINMAGCSMYSSVAAKFQNNGTLNGNGNIGGENSAIINTLT